MVYLSFVTLLWAFSFSLIGVYLSGQVDAWFSVLMRVALAALVFIPFTQFKGIKTKLKLQLMAIGGVQLGLMYCFYYQSFLLLSVPEVLLFTVMTPVYVTLIYDLLKRRFSPWYLVTALIAVAGAMVIKYASVNPNFMLGFIVVQASNLCFAIGQVSYKYIMEQNQSDPQLQTLGAHKTFGYFYFGAVIIACIGFSLFGSFDKMPTTSTQWGILIYLGIVASGLGYFLWNKGACLVNAGTLAAMNNALVPAGLIVNLLIWNKDADLLRLGIGGAIIVFSLWFNQSWVQNRQAQKKPQTSSA